MKKVVVVGGGVSGLATAWHLRRTLAEGAVPHEIQVLEASAEGGGKIRSERFPGGWLVESGPNGFLDNEPATLRLCSALGLDGQILAADGAAETRFLFVGGRLHPMPGSPGAFLRSPALSLSAKVRVAMEVWARPRPDHEETVHEWVSRRLGRQAADRLIDAMVSGIYAGDIRALSLKAAFPRIARMEEEYGGLFRALRAVSKQRKAAGERMGPVGSPRGRLTTFTDGLDVLVRTLARELGSALRTGARVENLDHREGQFVVSGNTAAGPFEEEADAVVVAVPAPAAARILRGLVPVAAEALEGIPYAAVAVVALGFHRTDVGHPLDGFGFLAPRCEGMRSLGARFASSTFPGRAPAGSVLVEVLIGGSLDPSAVALDDAALVDQVVADLAGPLGLKGRPTFTAVFRHERAIPQYVLGHEERVRRAEEAVAAFPGLALTGNALRGIAMNRCVAEAERIAASLASHLQHGNRQTVSPDFFTCPHRYTNSIE